MPEELLAQGISLDDDMVVGDESDEVPIVDEPIEDEDDVTKKVVPHSDDDEEVLDDPEDLGGTDDDSY